MAPESRTKLIYSIILYIFSLINKLLLPLILINLSFSGFLQVPIDYSSIQDALDDCFENDTILVSSGIYYENIIWPNKNHITLLGESLENTIINGNDSSSVIFISFEEENLFFSNTRIENFTLINGNATSVFPDDRGAGIFIMNASPFINNVNVMDCNASYGAGLSLINSNSIINNITIKNNSSYNSGAGIYLDNSNPILNNCNISNNYSSNYGGGIYSINNSKPEIILSKIYNNTAESGGGISTFNSSSPIIKNTAIYNNSANRGGGLSFFYNSEIQLDSCNIYNNNGYIIGGGIYSTFSNPIIENTGINSNHSLNGGGIYLDSDESPIFYNTILDGNTADESGGGIYINNNDLIINNITLKNNSAPLGGGIYIKNSLSQISNIIIKNNQANYGGGIFITNSDPIINNIDVFNNNAINGAGIFINLYSNVNIFNSNFNYNDASSLGGAIAIEQDSKIELNHCIIDHNTANIYGAGLYSWESSNFTIINNTIVDNYSEFGSAITSLSNSNGIIINTIIWDNQNNIFSDNNNINAFYSNIELGWQGEKNIRVNPKFQNTFYDSYLLNFDSKCINKGIDFFTIQNDTLLNYHSSEYNGIYPDIGANEYFGIIGDINNDGNINIFDILLLMYIISNDFEIENTYDVNNNGNIDILDVILLINMVINL